MLISSIAYLYGQQFPPAPALLNHLFTVRYRLAGVLLNVFQQKLNHPQISLLFHIHCFWNKVTGEKERKKIKPDSSMCPGTELAFYPVCPWYVTLGRITVQRCSYIILVLTLVVVEYLLSSTAQQFLQLGMDLELLLPPAFFLVIAKLHGLW